MFIAEQKNSKIIKLKYFIFFHYIAMRKIILKVI